MTFAPSSSANFAGPLASLRSFEGELDFVESPVDDKADRSLIGFGSQFNQELAQGSDLSASAPRP